MHFVCLHQRLFGWPVRTYAVIVMHYAQLNKEQGRRAPPEPPGPRKIKNLFKKLVLYFSRELKWQSEICLVKMCSLFNNSVWLWIKTILALAVEKSYPLGRINSVLFVFLLWAIYLVFASHSPRATPTTKCNKCSPYWKIWILDVF